MISLCLLPLPTTIFYNKNKTPSGIPFGVLISKSLTSKKNYDRIKEKRTRQSMDIVIEIFLEIYMELMMLIVPEKNLTRKHKFFAWVLAFTVLVGVCALAIWGLALMIDGKNFLGLIPLAFAVLISIAQIVAGIILYKKRR
jgi:hypothetical protein